MAFVLSVLNRDRQILCASVLITVHVWLIWFAWCIFSFVLNRVVKLRKGIYVMFFLCVLNRVRVSTSHLLPYTQILVKYPPLQVTNEWHIQILLFDLFWFSGDDVPAHLYGKTEFGDNVDNEWFIVSLLLQLSKVFPETCIRWDNYTLSGIYNSNET